MILSEINVYPIKSLKGISLNEGKTERRGLQSDRRWMLVDENNQFLTQREFPKLATINVEITEDSLEVSASYRQIHIPFMPEVNELAKVQIWQSKCRAKVYENSINEWFSDILQINCKLVLMSEETKRKVNFFYAVHADDQVSFADGYPFLLISENSLADLNDKLENPVPMNRFRPNFVVEDSEAFAEDNWKKIKIGKTIFHVVKPCARCVMTTIDQSTGDKDGQEPLKTLARYRTKNGKVMFGQNLIVENAGEILKVGDKIEILETRD